MSYVWLLKHPLDIVPVAGSSQISRLKRAIESRKIDMNIEQWFSIYTAALGKEFSLSWMIRIKA